MEASEVRRLVETAMDAAEIGRAARGRWFVMSDELVWVFEMDRGAAWSRWAMMVAAVVRGWATDAEVARSSGGHVVVDYALLGTGVPVLAAGTRFDDHRSYFTMMFDHTHDLVASEEWGRAFDYMAKDLRGLADDHPTLGVLRQAVSAGGFASAFRTLSCVVAGHARS